MNTGPFRIVVLHCGKFDYAEIEVDVPIHLIGPNNVGKTSLIALLQFLYLAEQRQMRFSRDMSETRRYYFPEKYSYALFECLTPVGFKVVGVRGLGPIKEYNFERFAYNGRIDLTDFLDEERRVREPEAIMAILATKGYVRLEPRHLQAALTGTGDDRGMALGLVPARHSDTYNRFCKVFCNILRLSHIRQEELKQLLLDIYGNEFQQREIDLAKNYAQSFEQVKRDSHEVQELKLLQPDIERLLQHLQRRDNARAIMPALWEAIGKNYAERKAGLTRREDELHATLATIASQEAELKKLMDAAYEELRQLAGRGAVLSANLQRLENERREFEGFVPEWAQERRRNIQARLETLIFRLRDASGKSVEQLKKSCQEVERRLATKRMQYDNQAHAALHHLRKKFPDSDITAAFTILNPDILTLPVNTQTAGIKLNNEKEVDAALKTLLSRKHADQVKLPGATLDLTALNVPRLDDYTLEQIGASIKELEQELERLQQTLAVAEQMAPLQAEKNGLEKERDELIRRLSAYELFYQTAANETGWQEELKEIRTAEEDLGAQNRRHEKQRNDLAEEALKNKSEVEEILRLLRVLQEEVQSLKRPPSDWPLQSMGNLPEKWEDMVALYKRKFTDEQSQSEQVRELLDIIEKRTYGRYVEADENATVKALRQQVESIPQRENALAEMWKSIAVGIKKELQSIGKDLDTLKALVNGLNNRLAGVSISNLAGLKLLVMEQQQWLKPIRNITIDDELPLFGNPKAAAEALNEVGKLLANHPRMDLKDLFNLSFEITTADGKAYRHEHLDAIESNGTTIAIKVLVNLVLLRSLLGRATVQIPFYLDECSSLDQANLVAIVNAARQMGFIAVLASPDAMDAAEKLYFINESPNGRVVLDPRRDMIKIIKPSETEGNSNA